MEKKKNTKNTKKTIIIIVSCVAALILIIGGILLLTKRPSGEKDNPAITDNLYLAGSQEHTTFSAKSGKNFQMTVIFAPNNSQTWAGNNEGCKYSIQALSQYNYCINQGWSSVMEDLSVGRSISVFNSVKDSKGYALIDINVPENINPCVQRFTVDVRCNIYAEENVKDYFNIEIV